MECKCDKCLRALVKKQGEQLKRQCKCLAKQEIQIKRQAKEIKCLKRQQNILKERLDLLYSIINISPTGEITIGSPANPVDNLYVDDIGSLTQPTNNIFTVDSITESFNFKGICLDDNTASLNPSFSSFPKLWLSSSVPISSVRTYHYPNAGGNNDRSWVQWLIQNGINVMIGITLSNYTEELDTLSADYLVSKSAYDQCTIAIAIGNEENPSQISQIQAGIAYARSLILNGKLPSTKLTTVLKDNGDWILNTYPPSNAVFTPNFAALEPSLDVICFNMYDAYYSPPFVPKETKLSWSSNGTSQLSVTLNGFGAVRNAMIKNNYTKLFWCTEVGWQWPETSVNNPGNSREYLKKFYTNFLNFNTTSMFIPEGSNTSVRSPDRIFYFTVRDVPAMSETFGLYKSSSTLVTKF